MSSRRPASRQPTAVPEEHATNGQRNSISLGPNDRLVGELYIEGDLRVSGTVEGNLEATGDIEIAGGGKVNGDVTAYNRLTVDSDASLIAGDVRVARLTVADGATFSGKVSMGKPAKKAPERTAAPAPEPVPEPVVEPVAVAVEPAPEPAAVAAAEPVAVNRAKTARPAPAKKSFQKGKRR